MKKKLLIVTVLLFAITILFGAGFPKGYISTADGRKLDVKNVYLVENMVYYTMNKTEYSMLLTEVDFVNARGKFEKGFANFTGGVGLVGSTGLVGLAYYTDPNQVGPGAIVGVAATTGIFYLGGKIIGWMLDPWKNIYTNPTKTVKIDGKSYTFNKADFKNNIAYSFIYPSNLISVNKPSEATDLWGEGTITKGDTTSTYSGQYTDDLMSVDFSVSAEQIEFSINNKSTETIRINWDNSCYISYYSSSMRIIHKGVKLTDKNLPQTPSIILPNTTFRDLAAPAEYVRFSNNSWNVTALIHGPYFGDDMPEQIVKANKIKDRKYSLMLNINVDGKSYDYLFNFMIVGKPTYTAVKVFD